MQALEQKLRELKARQDRKIKAYRESPSERIIAPPWLITYCVEDCGFVRQPTLAISKLTRAAFKREELSEFFSIAENVFAKPCYESFALYPKRGFTYLFIFSGVEDGSESTRH